MPLIGGKWNGIIFTVMSMAKTKRDETLRGSSPKWFPMVMQREYVSEARPEQHPPCIGYY
jgi:hypothetical protein